MAITIENTHKIQQATKWVVYTLLIINFVFYIFEDFGRSSYTLTTDSQFLDWTSAFATSIDESAWFFLLIMFELETYVLEDETWTGWIGNAVRGVRMICFVLIAHTIYAFFVIVLTLQPTVLVEGATSLCDLSDNATAYTYNLEYTEISQSNCAALSSDTSFYWVGEDPVVTDLAGLKLERILAFIDLVEAIAWLLILLAIETIVRLQGRNIVAGALVTMSRVAEFSLYTLILGFGIYWATLSHWLYLWDEIVWIGGFAAIEMNLSEWRNELRKQDSCGVTT